MDFKSKYDIGEEVYFWSIEKVKICLGKIEVISFYARGEDKETWNYGIAPFDTKNSTFSMISERIPEHLIFREREDVFDFCMKLTADI